MKRYIPNTVTLSRLLIFLPAIVVLFAIPTLRFTTWGHIVTNYHLIALCFFLGAMTDILDGALARRWHVESELGNILDHTIDKIFIIPAVYLMFQHLFGLALIAVLFLETITIGIALNLFFKKRARIEEEIWPNIPGKISYGFLIGATCVILVAVEWSPYWPTFRILAESCLAVVFGLRLTSLIMYRLNKCS